MPNNNNHIIAFIVSLLLLVLLTQTQTCTRQRCCLSSPACTSSYCSQKNSETWLSALSFTNYGYTKLVLSNNSCKPCSYNCKICSSQTTCTTCGDGFYMDTISSSCLLCSDRCTTCTVVNQITKCSVCQTGAYLDSTTLTCKSCPQGSSSCSSQTAIISCSSGYVKSSNSLYCLSCPSNCGSCPISNTVCSSCLTGYFLNSSQCFACSIGNCVACMRVGSSVFCSKCSSGYVLQSGVCNSCPSNCGTCSTTSTCTTCNSGYYVAGGSCLSVSSTISNCLTYSAPSTCSSCNSGYYLTNNLCHPCSLLCSQCIGNHFGLCTTCNSNANLFNQMCLVNNFPSSSSYQLFYSFPSASSLLTQGSLYCSNLFASSSTISLSLNNLQAYKIRVQWKVFSIGAVSSYNILLVNGYATTNVSSATTNPSYSYCSSNSSQTYFLSTSTSTFSTVAISNILTFSSGSTNLALQQIVILAYRCNSLCIQCSQTLCTQCMMATLYTQDAYCVYTCSNGYYIYKNSSSTTNSKQCLSSCPLGTYTLTSNASCVSCQSPCLTCLSQSFCLSCVLSYFLASDNTCLQQCPYKYYGQVQTQTCEQCVGKCLQCLSESQCLSCLSGFLQTSNLTCQSDCTYAAIGQNGFYADLSTLKCQLCDTNCLNCLYESSYCVQCSSTLYLYQNSCLSSCPDENYAPLGSNVCFSCEYPCKNCDTQSSFCTSCIEGYLYNNSCISSCLTSYYEDNVNLICDLCDTGCQQCYGSSSNCLSCLSPYFYYDKGCWLACPQGYYGSDSDLICYSCINPCLTCSNQTFCLSCKQNFLINGTCVSSGQCGTGYFANIASLSCQVCSSPCLSCQYTSSYCTSCDISNILGLIYLQEFSCNSNCSSVYYYSSVNSTSASCVLCQQPCLTCTSQSSCLSCISGYKYSNNICSSTCSVGTFFDSSIQDCTNCSSNCSICSNSLFCQSCSTGFYINSISPTQNQCLSTCTTGYYAEQFSSSCQTCIYPCETCSSSLDCLSCIAGVLYESRCISSCPDSTYLSILTSTCVSCSSNCMTCTSNSSECNSCYDGFYLDSLTSTCVASCPSLYYAQSLTKSCLKCASTCTECTNSTYCTECITNTTYLNPLTNMCVKFCPVGLFGSNSTNICENCDSKCSSCEYSSSNCLTCSFGYFFTRITATQAACLTSCANGYYNQSDNCYACVFPCETCTNSITCLTCADGTFYHQVSGSCLLACPSSTYYDFTDYICEPCSSPCQTCSNSTYCLGCQDSLYLYRGSCIANCPTKYYTDSSGICNRCYGLCATCASKYYCQTCLAGYAYSGYCYSSCPLGTFANMTAGMCQACTSPCTSCILTSTYCKKCNGGLFVYKGACSATCPDGTYQSNSQCLACSFPCVQCNSINTCNQCLGGYLLYMNISCIEDVQKCPNDFYKMDSKYCVPRTWCPANYYIDQDSKTCSSSCNITKYTDNSTRTCLNSCASGQYAGVDLFCQDYYPNVPSSLLGMSAITFIKSSYVYIIIQFNETIIWQSIASNMYTISQTQILSQTRLLMQLISNQLPGYSLVISDPTQLQLNLTTLPSRFNLTLPAYMVKSASTNYPLQNPTITVISPEFTKYQYKQIYSGSIIGQFSEGISWFILLLSLFFLFKNRLSDLYILWDTVQLLYLLLFLDIQYPPNLNQFFVGLKYTHLYFLPSIFSIDKTRSVSDQPFYAYSYDNHFMRNTGHQTLLLIIVLSIFILLKIGQTLIKKVQKVKQIVKQYPSIKGFIYRGILRYRWHHFSDFVFITYSNVMLFAFSSIYFMSQNQDNAGSNVFAIISCMAYIGVSFFFGYKLYKHYPNISRGKLTNNLKCFYRGIQKDNKFGVALVLIRYIRKFVYALVVSIFSKSPMYAIPILMFTSVLMALFMFINLPFKKKLSNIITIMVQIILSFVFFFIVLIHYNNEFFDSKMKQTFGWACCFILAFIIFALIYEVFCKTMFYLQPQQNPKQKEKVQDMDEDYIRKKAGEFFDSVFPKLRERLNLEEDSDDQLYHYEDGDSQNSQNNELRQRDLQIESSSQSDQFRHYDNNSQSQVTDQKSKQKLQAPKFLVRCVKDLQ